MAGDHYAELGVAQSASSDELQAAYRNAARRWHPDVCSSPEAPERMRRINEAYAALRDPARRAAYDQSRVRRIIGSLSARWGVQSNPSRQVVSSARAAVPASAAAEAYGRAKRVVRLDPEPHRWVAPQLDGAPPGDAADQARGKATSQARNRRARQRGGFAEAIRQVTRVAPVQLATLLLVSAGVLAGLGFMASGSRGASPPEPLGGSAAAVAALAAKPVATGAEAAVMAQQSAAANPAPSSAAGAARFAQAARVAPLPPLPVLPVVATAIELRQLVPPTSQSNAGRRAAHAPLVPRVPLSPAAPVIEQPDLRPLRSTVTTPSIPEAPVAWREPLTAARAVPIVGPTGPQMPGFVVNASR